MNRLIETAHKCGDRTTDCSKCDFYNMENCVDELNKELACKLEMAMDDLKHDCKTCYYFEFLSINEPCSICVDRDKWEWRGKNENKS